MLDFEHDEQKRENAAKFILAADKLLVEHGSENLSIRKIAKEAGFHSSTIYLYFKDLEQLLLLATMKYFRIYEKALEQYSKQLISDPYQYFIDIWELFIDSAFQYPFTFRNFFFGKYSNHLNEILDLYYKIFPEKKNNYSGIIQEMFAGHNLLQRNLSILSPLSGKPGFFPADKLDLVNRIIVSCFKDVLDQACTSDESAGRSLDHKKEVMDIIEYVIKTSAIV